MRPPDSSAKQLAAAGETIAAQRLVALALLQSPEPCAISRADGALVFVNAAMLRAARLDSAAEGPADLLTFMKRFRAAGFDDPAAALDEVLRTGRAFKREVTDFESERVLALRLSLLKPEPNSPSSVSVSTETNRDDDSAVTRGANASAAPDGALGFAFTVRDVTLQREAERLRTALSSLVSHELRTPLTSIGGFAELLADDDELPAEAREFLVIIREEAGRLTRMVNAFFAGVQSEGDGSAAVCEPVSLDALAREAVTHFASAAAERGVLLSQSEGPRLPPVAADRRMVRRVLASVLEETLRRTAAGAVVSVSASLEAMAVSLSIETRPAPSSRAGAEASPDGEALLRGAVEQHGGRLSRELSAGAERVRLTFPRL
jgi:signal transduction histidine kinase